MKLSEIVAYRKKADSAREEFLQHLAVLQAKQGNLGDDIDYNAAVTKIVQTEIIPAARTFRNKLQAIDEAL